MNIGMRWMKFAAAATLLGLSALADPASATGLVQVEHNVSPLVARASFVGHHNPTAVLDISVALNLRNTTQLTSFMQELQDPASSNYHKFLTPAQFTALYGPTQAQVSAVVQFLRGRGVAVTSVSANRTRIHASASVATLESAFGVAVNDYSYQGAGFYAASSNPNIPANLGPLVLSVMGLESASVFQSHALPAPQNLQSQGGVGLKPAGFSPLQIATAYGWPSLTDTTQAAGVTVAIATAFTYRTADVQKFWSEFGLPSHSLTNIPIDGTTLRLNTETTLDIERSSSMSPGSAIMVYEAVNPGFNVFDDEFVKIATDGKADVVSTSWGLAEARTPFASVQSEHASFIQMNVEGMAILAAAGDGGSADRISGSDNADYPSSDPLVVAAGGTSLFLNPDNTISGETAWSGAGGADSLFFAVPAFQAGFTNGACNADHTADFPGGGGCAALGADSRQSSDIAMDADPATGYSIYYNGRWEVFGGTSFVAPEMAGFFAIVTARYRVLDSNTTARIGSANPWIYADAAAHSADFNDITSGCNGMFCAGSGWDHPTGWGTPHNANTMAADIAGLIPL